MNGTGLEWKECYWNKRLH